MSKKCSIDGSHVLPCAALSGATEFGNPPPKTAKKTGIFVWALTSMTTRKPSRTMYGAKTSEHPKGLIFNFCPWCGVDLQASHTSKEPGDA